jgi:hypothetical protein
MQRETCLIINSVSCLKEHFTNFFTQGTAIKNFNSLVYGFWKERELQTRLIRLEGIPHIINVFNSFRRQRWSWYKSECEPPNSNSRKNQNDLGTVTWNKLRLAIDWVISQKFWERVVLAPTSTKCSNLSQFEHTKSSRSSLQLVREELHDTTFTLSN